MKKNEKGKAKKKPMCIFEADVVSFSVPKHGELILDMIRGEWNSAISENDHVKVTLELMDG